MAPWLHGSIAPMTIQTQGTAAFPRSTMVLGYLESIGYPEIG